MAVRVEVSPVLLAWAIERSGRERAYFEDRFPRLAAWESGELLPTVKQLEALARASHAPIGAFFLAEPPVEQLPVPDFRTIRDEGVTRPTADLLDTIFLCEQRQEWYRDFARVTGEPAPELVGSLELGMDILDAAEDLRGSLDFDLAARRAFTTWADALRGLTERAEAAGVLVMVSGVVGSNTHRRLDPNEFRGFALADPLAPLVFVNGADTRAAQIFTLTHELVHVAVNESALSNPDLGGVAVAASNDIERWCNEVAAELLVPLSSLQENLAADEPIGAVLQRLARLYKVSSLVILRRVHDAGKLPWEEYRSAFSAELERAQGARAGATGGNFYNTQPVRVSRRFARAVVTDTLEGRTLYTEAFRLLGFRKHSTFEALGEKLGVT